MSLKIGSSAQIASFAFTGDMMCMKVKWIFHGGSLGSNHKVGHKQGKQHEPLVLYTNR